MKQCVICKQDTGIFGKKTYNGYICKQCRLLLPSNIQLKAADTDYLMKIIERNKEKKKRFSATAHYGSMYIDSVHNMFCISKAEKDGEPTSFGDIYDVAELVETGIYCTDVRNIGTKTNKIVCNVKLKVKTDSVSLEYLISQNDVCSFKKGKNNMLDVNEPETLTMFRNLFYQMIDNVRYGLLKRLEDIQRLKAKLSDEQEKKDWAKGVLFLDSSDCTLEEIKHQQRKLLRMFHPDINPDMDVAYTEKINRAYEILVPKKQIADKEIN